MARNFVAGILKIARISNTFRKEQINDPELHPALHLYINYLYRHQDGVKQEEFVDRLLLDKTTVTRQLNKLERNGYIYREVSKEDGRCRLIYPTQKALDVYPEIQKLTESFEHQLFEGLTGEEIDELTRLMTKVEQNAVNAVQKERGNKS